MSVLKIDLSPFPERFSENSRELIISNNVNFIFGKNGTGKTTISGVITSDFSSSYNTQVFSGFEDIVGENYRLDAVSLGTENSEIQKEINEISKEIDLISEKIKIPEDDSENLFTTFEAAKEELIQQENQIDSFYTAAARDIKNKKYDNINIAVTSYNREKFKYDINKAKLLSDGEVLEYRETLKAEEKQVATNIKVPEYNLFESLEYTNRILKKFVSHHQIIEELDSSTDKQQFAREGMRIHKQDSTERCAFCGNLINADRWKLLGNYFNDEVKRLEQEISIGIDQISTKLKSLLEMKEVEANIFYPRYFHRIQNTNARIRTLKEEYKKFFDLLVFNLDKKRTNLFGIDPGIEYDIPNNFADIKSEYESIAKENNAFAEKLNTEQEKAKNALRLFEVKKALDIFDYEAKCVMLENLRTIRDKAQKAFETEVEKIEKKKQRVDELMLLTKDERIIADQINNKLKDMGVSSFSLELVKDDEMEQKGQYKIRGYGGEIRHITELSKGEKNIIAFLYFLLRLGEVDSDNRPKIVILDDPMTSNDDTMQYLMIGEIRKFYLNISDKDFLLVLTHNCHFYLNVRPNTATKYKVDGAEISYYKKYGNFHLLSNGKQTTFIRIENGTKDFRTNYEMLWCELQFLYFADKPNLMLNVCRKICETYMAFTKKSIEAFYGDNINAKKLFDVNQHCLDDIDAEQNGRTKEEIRDILKGLFERNNAVEHFNSYFRVA